jgi:hypothetical protein
VSVWRVPRGNPFYLHLRRTFVEVGDTVTIGPLGQVHWVVIAIQPRIFRTTRMTNLRSGLTGVHRYNVPIEKLVIHTKGLPL